MRDVDLSGADLTDAKMSVSLMERVNLSGADLRGSSMNIVYITDADLRGANLQKIRCDQFTLPYLAASRLDGASMSETLRSQLNSSRVSPET
jgi:uncharacterized protein YjbI with pentapeptide repeats